MLVNIFLIIMIILNCISFISCIINLQTINLSLLLDIVVFIFLCIKVINGDLVL